MKKLMIAYIAVAYATLLSFILWIVSLLCDNNVFPTICFILGLVCVLAMGILSVCVCIFAIIKRNDDNVEIFKKTLINKLILTPFFIINFICCFLIFAGLLNPFLAWSIFIIVPLQTSFAYMIAFTTGTFNIFQIIKQRNTSALKSTYIVLILMHFVFVLDVVASLIVYLKSKNINKTDELKQLN